MNRLIIIDGNAILHRAYHALPPLTNKKGELTNAVYGFASILLKILADFKPSHLVVTFDKKAQTFRKKLYKEYQAKRPEMDKELASQIDKVHQLVRQLTIPIYELDGYEADDLIGTLALQAKSLDEIVIVTGDRDILQLVNSKTKVFMPVKGLSEGKIYDEKAVYEKYGLKPIQIVDLKALTGDQSDNYPGVKGIGPKTAVRLLTHLKTLEDIYNKVNNLAKIAGITNKTINALKNGEKDAQLSKQLATIVKDAPVSFNFEKAKWHADKDKIRMVLLDFDFETLAKRVGPPSPSLRQAKKEENNQLGLF